ncbi:MAG: YcxB family protein [Mobilitalea sp.]
MTYEFQIEKQDYIDFNLNHIITSPTMKRSLIIQRFIALMIVVVFPLILAKVTEIPLWYWYCAFGIAFILWFIFYPKHVKKLIVMRISKLLKEGSTHGILGKHTLTINKDGIVDTTEYSESKCSLIEKIIVTEKHIFIYISPLVAYIVPTKIYKNAEEKSTFLSALNSFKKVS